MRESREAGRKKTEKFKPIRPRFNDISFGKTKDELTPEELKAIYQQLTASEQQLRAVNEQLKADEQQLKASNQQLQATEQQLRAANQQLLADQEELGRLNRDLDKLADDLGIVIEGSYWTHGCYDGIVSFSANSLKHAKQFQERFFSLYHQDIVRAELLEKLVVIKEGGFTNPLITKTKRLLYH